MKKMLFVLTCLCVGNAFAHDHAHHAHSPELQQAMVACKDSTDKIACLEQKGFKKPADHAHSDYHKKDKHPPEVKKAKAECKALGKTSKEAMTACLADKGFKKPDNHPAK